MVLGHGYCTPSHAGFGREAGSSHHPGSCTSSGNICPICPRHGWTGLDGGRGVSGQLSLGTGNVFVAQVAWSGALCSTWVFLRQADGLWGWARGRGFLGLQRILGSSEGGRLPASVHETSSLKLSFPSAQKYSSHAGSQRVAVGWPEDLRTPVL